jgi:predicted secreted Zn-dependent protease
MKRVAALAALALAGAACVLPGRAEAPDLVATEMANPLADGLTVAALTDPVPTAVTPEPVSIPQPTLPTPVTTSSVSETIDTFGAVTVVTTSYTTRYALTGETAFDLEDYMRANGPLDSVGNRWYALTDPVFNWEIPCTCDEGSCAAGPVTVFVSLDYTLPVWEPPYGADVNLVAKWRYFERALLLHERGHGDLASVCGQWLGEAFVALPPQLTCEAVKSAALEASNPVFAECRAAQRQYEDETNHGQNEGVIWPP